MNASRLIVLGVDYQRTPIALRERLAFGSGGIRDALNDLGTSVDEAFILSTCNRTEIYALGRESDPARALLGFIEQSRGVPGDSIMALVYVHHGSDAFRHLCRVASGLHSMMVGEPHILAQVRQSLDASREVGTLGPILSRAGNEALRAGKRARTETGISRSGESIPKSAVQLAIRQLGELSKRKAIVIGAGEMGGHTSRLLRAAGIKDLVVLNRTVTRAETLARSIGCRFGSLEQLESEIDDAHLIVSAATLPRGFIVDELTLRRRRDPTAVLLIDLGVPRSIDPVLRGFPNVDLYDVDDLDRDAGQRRHARLSDLAAVEEMVDDAVESFSRWWAERAVAPTISALRERAEIVRKSELDRSLRRLNSLSNRDREVVASLSVAIVNKLLHTPVTRMKQGESGQSLAAAVISLFDLEHPKSKEKELEDVEIAPVVAFQSGLEESFHHAVNEHS